MVPRRAFEWPTELFRRDPPLPLLPFLFFPFFPPPRPLDSADDVDLSENTATPFVPVDAPAVNPPARPLAADPVDPADPSDPTDPARAPLVVVLEAHE